ncbi:folate/biopterin family MFS transporter [Acaryochloris sp. IP29b_bin.137]|uniref:folate/biopterin family MFS transporter n=1 Tax=Acaryochloris sp. IP29b_bin.137 TaxID=2969217 RepID=UPI0026217AAE|nr:folate/biopterin family MFS transporter [Acaryochloris sp. IP29b_bin.137]
MFVSQSRLDSVRDFLKENVFYGQDPTPELLAILMVYFVQGILGLARLAVSFFLKDDLGLTPAQVAAMMGIAALPWVIKPIFGFVSDSVPIFGYRRRSYLILSGLLGCLAWAGMASIVHTSIAATIAIVLSSLSVAISDVIVDSLVVERVRQESQSDAGSLQSLCWSATALGGILTAYFSGWLLAHMSTQSVFWITATFPLLVSAIAGLIADPKVGTQINLDSTKQQVSQLWQAITQKQILLPVIFVFFWQATPSSEAAFFFFTTNDLGFDPEFLGRVRLVTSLAALLGIWVFQRYLKAVPVRRIFLWSTLIAAALGMTTLLLVTHTNRALGISDEWFSLGDSLILTVMGQIAYMPVLVLAARLCPPGIEATMFALLMSVSNLAGLLSHESGALIMHGLGITETNFQQLWLLVIIANLSTLLPLPLLNWLPDQGTDVLDQDLALAPSPSRDPLVSEALAVELVTEPRN